MSKTTKVEASRPNRVRFMMLDADLSDGNFNELTQVIAAALGRSNLSNSKIVSLPPATGINTVPTGNGANGNETTVDEETAGEVEQPIADTSRPPRKAGQPRTPKYDNDLFNKEQGEEFKSAYGSLSSHSQRYLVAAHWLKEKLGKPTINQDQVYTCYRAAGWTTDIRDWDVNFRQHTNKTNKLRRVNPGEYAITPLGESSIPAPAITN